MAPRPGLGGVLGGAQLVLGLLTLGDIPDREHDFEAVVVVGDAARRQFDVEQMPVAVLGQRFAGTQRLLPQRLPPDVFGAGREQDVDRLAVQVRRLPAEDMADVVVEAGDVIIFNDDDAVERGLGQLLKAQAGARQLQLAVLELGDVGGDGDHLAAAGAALGDLQPAVAHEGFFEGRRRMIMAVDPPGQPRARVIGGGGEALLAQIPLQQFGKSGRTASSRLSPWF